MLIGGSQFLSTQHPLEVSTRECQYCVHRSVHILDQIATCPSLSSFQSRVTNQKITWPFVHSD